MCGFNRELERRWIDSIRGRASLLKAEEVVAETFGQLERRIFLLASCQVHSESKRCIHRELGERKIGVVGFHFSAIVLIFHNTSKTSVL
jgi:hypothetical protein